MAGVCTKKLKNGKVRAWFIDYNGKQKFFSQHGKRSEVLKVAEGLEADHGKIRVGYAPVPKISDDPWDFDQIVREYLAWGTAQGGHGGRPWSSVHVATRTRHLGKFWPALLKLKTIQDVTLPKVEYIARELQLGKAQLPIVTKTGTKKTPKPATGKTVQSHLESIKSFCLWAKGRGYYEVNPLEGMVGFDTTPKQKRRAMTADEIGRLLEVAPSDRQLVYEVAMCTGYRKGELSALKVADLNLDTCSLSLAAEHCKGRRASRQPIPASLAEKLKATSEGKGDDAPLLKVSTHVDRYFNYDLIAANVLVTAPGGSLVFHSLRHTYCTLVIESGASLTEAQRLLRHQDPKMTANTYSHARQDRLQSTAEAVGKTVMLQNDKNALGMHALAAGAETVDVKACDQSILDSNTDLAGDGFDARRPLLFKPFPIQSL